jgi:type I restriction enzyme S subunit
MTLVLKPKEIYAKRLSLGRLGAIGIADDWKTAPLGDLIELLNGAPFDSNLFNRDGIGKPLIRIRDVGKDDTETWFSGEFDEKYLISSGDVLVGLDGDFRVAEWHGAQALLNQRVCKLVPKQGLLDKRFMLYHLAGWLDAIWEETSATTVKHLSSKTIQEIPFPQPPIEEQRRIVEALDDHLSRLDKAGEELDSASKQCSTLRSSILNELLNSSGEADQESPAKWASKPLGELAATQLGKMLNRSNQVGDSTIPSALKNLGEVALLRKGMTITSKTAKSGTVPVIAGGKRPAYFHNESNRAAKTITVSSSGAYAGFVAFHPQPIWASDCTTIEPIDSKSCLPEYLFYFLQARQNEIYALQRGSGMPHVYAKDLALLEIKVPTLDEQRLIVDRVDSSLDALGRTQLGIDRQRSNLIELRRSLLNQAFTGTLRKGER